MRQENSYLEFNNPIHIIWRSGKPDDPYIDRLDIAKVVNQRVALLEIPDELYRVRISNMQEINYERFIKDKLSANDFYVDYTNGFVYFHPSKEAETISIVYKGRGMLLYPSSRIIHFDGTTPSENLHEIIENVKKQVQHLIDETQNFEEVLKKMVIATNLTNEASDRATQAAQQATNAVELVNDAYKTTVLIYMPFVQKEKDIETTYPNPMVGWTVQVFETGVRYRWNGQDWVPIDAFGGNIPKASDVIDGLMSKEDYVKLKEITDHVDTRVIVFFIPQQVLSGVQEPHFPFPFNGEIIDVSASVSKKGSSNTAIRIEKSTDYTSWQNILNSPLLIQGGEFFDADNHAIADTSVKEGDIFRLYVPYSGDAQNLTLNIKIKVSKQT
ncbi:hypothetical protein ABE073_03825 [Lederbergia citrisecunda]|uniref:hypothetical protein n=1 Tax=Lederbergia citrisecunda TaxID=2833583 RepID=UPI003D2C6F3F